MVRAAYRQLALRLHPDKHQGNPHFEEQFKQVTEAYRVLGDATRRARYDALLLARHEQQQQLNRQQRAGTPGNTTYPPGHRYHYNTTRRPATFRERYYNTTPQQAARLSRRDRRALLLLLILLTTGIGALAMWTDARRETHAEEAYLEGVLNLKSGRWDKALVNWSETLSEQPTNGAAYARRAEVRQEFQHDYATAISDYDAALRHLTATADRVHSLYGRGTCRAAMGQIAAAHLDLSQALHLDPAYAPARLARGELALYARQDYAAAVTDFTALMTSVTASPTECTRAVRGRGLAWYRQGDAERATHDFIIALSADETDGQAWYLLSRAAAAQQQPDRAAAYAANARRYGYTPPAALD